MLTDTRYSPYAAVHGTEAKDTIWTKGFWADVSTNNANHTVPQLQSMFEAPDISHVVENFRICAGDVDGDFAGTVFGDGDFYKWMEAAVYEAIHTRNEALISKLDEYIDLIGRAQQNDGYISTKQIIGERKQNGVTRQGDVNDFEVYNLGHLFTSACLHKRLTGKDHFLFIAEKAAGYLQKLYTDAAKNKNVQTAVCPSHYMGIIELYRTTGKRKYLELANLAITLRDQVENGMDDNQDSIPTKKHDKIIGHAVRANYLYAGVADLYLETGDQEYLDMLDRVWSNLVNHKIYVTGGCGALYNGASPYGYFFKHQLVHQAYGYEYQLPNITAYNETCAAVGLVMWAYRMFQIRPKAEYFDMIERVFLNAILPAVSLDGKKFFYENMLRRTKDLPYELIWPLTRSEYILSYCCPPNLARALAQSNEYLYTLSNGAIWTGLYGESKASLCINGENIILTQTTEYPFDGQITFHIEGKRTKDFELMVRIPSWCRSAHIRFANQDVTLTKEQAGSYYRLIVPKDCTLVQLDLPMDIRYTTAHRYVEEVTMQTAIERGPLVYCMEQTDYAGSSIDHLLIDPKLPWQPVRFELQGRPICALEGTAVEVNYADGHDEDTLYKELDICGLKEVPIRLIPYFAWDNRVFGEMKVWFPLHLS